jgi:S-DNA-T family DNA segregation ATPase FtsK/SpoIIIE
MSRTVTVIDAATGARADVRLTPDTARVTDLVARLQELTCSTHPRLGRAGTPLDDRTRVGDLRDGEVLEFGPRPGEEPPPKTTLEVTAGPDAGRRWPLPPGAYVIGRLGDLAVDDETVARHHARIVVSAMGQVAVEVLSAQQPATPWLPGEPLTLGHTTIVHGRTSDTVPLTAAAAGTALVNRAPRIATPARPRTITFPAAPTAPTRTRIPVLASVAPLAVGVALAVVLRRWEFLAFAVMSPLVVLGQAGSDRWSAHRELKRARRAHDAAVAAAEDSLAAALAEERLCRLETAPDLAAVAAAARGRTTLLWQRGIDDDDTLLLRLGLGSLPAETTVEGRDVRPVIDGVPVCLTFENGAVVGICGGPVAHAVARTLLLQAAVLHGPSALTISVVAPGQAGRWSWTRWLPHLRRSDGRIDLALHHDKVRRLIDDGEPHADARRLVVIAGASDTTLAGAFAAQPRTCVIWVADDAADLPGNCSTVITVDATAPHRLRLRSRSAGPTEISADLVPACVAEDAARALAPLRDAGAAATSLPTLVRWSDLNELPVHDVEMTATAMVRRWGAGATTRIRLGLSARGPVELDLRDDGPHALVAGTTGAGKSELLQTLVAGLAAGSSPADLSLLLVDFKGGAAFGACTRLPHTVGVLTDLDTSTTTRALQSLSAELRRRERLLADEHLPDLESWLRRRPAADERHAMSRLVIVVDEFATLAEELPDFVGGLVGIAQRGRSLGVHLVLATQRPEGAVSADIRANTRLRICLAVARDAESRDVIDSPAAVGISRTTPGRALIRVDSGGLLEVQTARVAAPCMQAETHEVVLLSPGDDDLETRAQPDHTDAPTELDLLVEAASHAAATSGAACPHPPWLPPLPTEISLAGFGNRVQGGDTVTVGLVDEPHELRQSPMTVRVTDAEPLLIVGGARSGRTTAALAHVVALAAASSPDELHVWAIDGGGGLDQLRSLPHVGAVIDARDCDRVERLFVHLATTVEQRRRSPQGDSRRLLLVVDTWEAVTSADADAGRCTDLLVKLLVDGPAAGLRIVVTGGRAALTGRLASAISEKFCLQLADPSDYLLLGVPPREVPRQMPPGRALRARDHALVQFASADEAAWDNAAAWPAPTSAPRRFEPLPACVPLHAVFGRRGRDVAGVVVGLRGDDLQPVILDPAETGTFLVSGPPRSGRSTTLLSIAAQIHDRRVTALCTRTSGLQRRRDLAHVVDVSDQDGLEQAMTSLAIGGALLVDDIDLIDDQRVLDQLETAVRSARDAGGFVVLAGTTDAMTASFRGPVAHARRARSGLLLRPESPHDGELLGLRLRRRGNITDPPGRGILALHGHAVAVQVPNPD